MKKRFYPDWGYFGTVMWVVLLCFLFYSAYTQIEFIISIFTRDEMLSSKLAVTLTVVAFLLFYLGYYKLISKPRKDEIERLKQELKDLR